MADTVKAFHRACYGGDVAAVEKLLSNGAAKGLATSKDKHGATGLQQAAYAGHADIVLLLGAIDGTLETTDVSVMSLCACPRACGFFFVVQNLANSATHSCIRQLNGWCPLLSKHELPRLQRVCSLCEAVLRRKTALHCTTPCSEAKKVSCAAVDVWVLTWLVACRLCLVLCVGSVDSSHEVQRAWTR
jgi:hypothetical protein